MNKRDRLVTLIKHLRSLTTAGFVLWVMNTVESAVKNRMERLAVKCFAWLQVYLKGRSEILSAGIIRLAGV